MTLKYPHGFAPPIGCRKCPRLVAYRKKHRKANPDWYNGAVPPWGPLTAELLIIGLAPGLKGAHRTGRVFTGDGAGTFLFHHLQQAGFVSGTYQDDGNDDVTPINTMITNAVACVPPQNKPENAELINCQPYLKKQLRSLPKLQAILCLGLTAHNAFLKSVGLPLSSTKFSHGAKHKFSLDILEEKKPITLFDSYHCSRYNTQTRRLTSIMFAQLMTQIAAHISANNP